MSSIAFSPRFLLPAHALGVVSCLLTALVAAAAPGANAWAQQFEQRRSIYLEAGHSLDNNGKASTAALGLSLPMQQKLWDGRISMAWNFYLSGWDGDAREGQRKYYAQIGVVPMFRYHFDEGASPWFVDAGIGASYLHKTYEVGDKRFGSRWNFSDHLGVGRVFGAQQEQELGLYVKHVSNAGFKEPNPGETFLELRYAHTF
ncbi:acyloxyacyl hydrolase [Extensimonas vulgaris]|jgi:lipid A 3-O-deacylase|uniref:Lipid A deacylase n=1 Tax=Extensimonas vulgaris TaxID=1031594 RepID=A0A369AJS7_9BURK|nr:acyloxyacyl hydrolase [Extensimonas vulgaris]RCX08536.1 lipid A 3-O-deacylase [Extensimonas vulgaris]TWI34894.1 lipid A 3-O-deacylase [Extensimonas vulgaris]TXD14060.1 acyloxyacyl hydrolase [Extensimonas vulgaris]